MAVKISRGGRMKPDGLLHEFHEWARIGKWGNGKLRQSNALTPFALIGLSAGKELTGDGTPKGMAVDPHIWNVAQATPFWVISENPETNGKV